MSRTIHTVIAILVGLLGACGEGQLPEEELANTEQAMAMNTSVFCDPATRALEIEMHCGDTLIGKCEACDKGNLAGKSCKSFGYEGGALKCTSKCSFDTSSCKVAVCGTGVRRGDEQCDGGDLGGTTCADLGFQSGTLKCGPGCTFDRSGCLGGCGNGKLEGSEACDGAAMGWTTCKSLGFDGGTLKCTGGCTLDTSGCYKCGDGKISGPEVCDGALLNGKTCGALGYQGGALSCSPTCLSFDKSQCTWCGDGKRNGNEQCDGQDLGGAACSDFGLLDGPGPGLSCRSDCRFDTRTCYRQDPYGYVRHASTGNPIVGATVTCLVADANGNFVRWPAEQFGDANPVGTNASGYYSFMVPQGSYKVEVKKSGYLTHVSPVLVVAAAPVQYDVDLKPVPTFIGTKCGGLGKPCCNSSACNKGLFCFKGTCVNLAF